jgi:tryptophan-rich sensory protein
MDILNILAILVAVVVYLLPQKAEEQVRLVLYAGFLAMNCLWTSMVRFRFRSLFYVVVVVLVGELRGLSFPLNVVPVSAIWFCLLILYLAASYGAFAAEPDPEGSGRA